MTEANILSTEHSAQVRDALIHAARVQEVSTKKAFNISDVALLLGKSDDTVRRWVRLKNIPAPNKYGVWEATTLLAAITNPHA